MTNFEYILKNMSERDLAAAVIGETSPSFLAKIRTAFYNWQSNLAGVGGNMHFVDDPEHQPNVFTISNLYFYSGIRSEYRGSANCKELGHAKNCKGYNKYAMPRTNVLSMEIWLTKQYNPKEWTDEEN